MLASMAILDGQGAPLASHGLDCFPWGTNEGQARICTFSRKGRVLAQLQCPLVSCHVGVWSDVRSRSPDVYPGSPAPLQSVLCDRHRDMQRGRRD